MSRKKDIERAKRFCYRSGEKVPTYIIKKRLKEEQDAKNDKALSKLGLVRGKADVIIPSIATSSNQEEEGDNVLQKKKRQRQRT